MGIRRASGPPKRVELIYLPFYVFEVLLTDRGGDGRATVSVDGLIGHAMFFVEEGLDYVSENDGVVCDFVLGSAEARRIAAETYRWRLLEQDLRNKRRWVVKEIQGERKIFYPFWLGYFWKGRGYDFKALDGVSGEVQGVKMRKVFLKALRQLG